MLASSFSPSLTFTKSMIMDSSERPSTPPDSAMHLDLSNLPPLVAPTPPSNTLLITELTNPAIFTPASLAAIRTFIERECGASTLHGFAPLRSMQRIIVSFTDTEPAVALRRALDGTSLLGCRVRLYFGEPTPLRSAPVHLEAPASNKLFFISPPPSPPHGWSMRNEEPPNKEVHAADLAAALADLERRSMARSSEQEYKEVEMSGTDDEGQQAPRRKSSTVVYQPETHGGSPGLPAVLVVDTTDEGLREENERRILEHTSRPPVELME